MQEAKALLIHIIEFVPIGTRRLKELKSPHYISLDELCWAMDRSVDMGLRRKVHDRSWLMLGEELGDQLGVSDVTSDKCVPGIRFKGGQILEIACVGEFVEVDDRIGFALNPVQDEVRANESGSAGNEYGGHREVYRLRSKVKKKIRERDESG
jgi:hypothetical protein